MEEEVVEGAFVSRVPCPPHQCKSTDGKLLVMNPIDPAFLLIPILKATIPVRWPVTVSTMILTSSQTDGTAGNFRPADDIFEQAASTIMAAPSLEGDTPISLEDIQQLSSLRCTHIAMRRICDFKGMCGDMNEVAFPHVRVRDHP